MRAVVLSVAVSLGFLLLSLYAIRRQRLRERQALLWIGVFLMLVFLSATLPLHILDHVAHFVGIAYPPDLLLLIGILFLVALVFQLSIALARLSAKQTVLVQEIGLLTARIPPEQGLSGGTSEAGSVTPATGPQTAGDA